MTNVVSRMKNGVGAFAAVAGLSCVACDELSERVALDRAATGHEQAATVALEAAPPPDDELAIEPVRPGRWRLAPPSELVRTMLWVSHILVRHDAVAPGVVSFDLGDWTPAPAVPKRTRKEAFELARESRSQLLEEPGRFADIARQRSEDVATSERGGSLGGVSGFDFYFQHGLVLDTLSNLEVGSISPIVETKYGFHIFQRRAPAVEQVVSGARVVIAYDGAPWLKSFLARWPIPSRSREEAMAIANVVYTRARAGESFEALVEEYSDHVDAVRDGDFGAWSTHERTPFPREVEILGELEVGAVAPPLDSPFGVEVIKRTANRPRWLYAMTTVQQSYDGSQTVSHPASRASVERSIQALAREIQGENARFAALQSSYCCAQPEQWVEGQGPAAAEKALASLEIGEISASPVSLPGAFAIIKRMEPLPVVAPLPPLFELPSPARPDLEDLARRAQFNYQLPTIARRVREALSLDGDVAERFTALHDAEVPAEGEREETRLARFSEFLKNIADLLGEPRYRVYKAFVERHFEEHLLDRGAQALQRRPK